MRLINTIALLLLLFFSVNIHGQTSCALHAWPDTTINCGNSATLHAFQDTSAGCYGAYSLTRIPYQPYSFSNGTNTGIGVDDIYGGVINLPFPFQFFDSSYDYCIIGANGNITFDTTQALNYDPWPIASLPAGSNTATLKSIMGPLVDVDPTIGGSIKYAVYGTAPCRRFVVSYDTIPYYLCYNTKGTFQIVLHETTGIIDVFIKSMSICPSWNSGNCMLGIENGSGSIFYTFPGKNGQQWADTNAGYSFVPIRAGSFDGLVYNWYNDMGNLVGTGSTVTVHPEHTTVYSVKVKSTMGCDTTLISAYDTVYVNGGTQALFSENISLGCHTDTVTFVNNSTGAVSQLWDLGDGFTSTAITPAQHIYSDTGTYIIKLGITNGVCSDTMTQTINLMPSISFVSPTSVVIGDTVLITASVNCLSNNYMIVWMNYGVPFDTTYGPDESYIKGPGADSISAEAYNLQNNCPPVFSDIVTVYESVYTVSLHSNIKVFPNPFNNTLNISGLERGDIINLYDVLGRKIDIDLQPSSNNTMSFNSMTLNAGMYILSIRGKDGHRKDSVPIIKE